MKPHVTYDTLSFLWPNFEWAIRVWLRFIWFHLWCFSIIFIEFWHFTHDGRCTITISTFFIHACIDMHVKSVIEICPYAVTSKPRKIHNIRHSNVNLMQFDSFCVSTALAINLEIRWRMKTNEYRLKHMVYTLHCVYGPNML